MNTLDINTIAFQYLLRADAQKNNNKSEDLKREVTRINLEQNNSQKSLLFQMYELEEEESFLSN